MKSLQKYFVAILPPQEILKQVHDLKIELREEFGVKYALKSPPHITLKMPFVLEEKKVDLLRRSVEVLMENSPAFEVTLKAVDHFRRKVIFLQVILPDDFTEIQKKLVAHLKREFHLPIELSDSNYHPHMTVAFQDIKKADFDSIYDRVKSYDYHANFLVKDLWLLQKNEGVWKPLKSMEIGKK